MLDGVLPPDEFYEEFSNVLRERNIRLSRRSDSEYTLYANKGEAQSDAFVHEQLTQLCEELEHPILWPALAEKAGDQAAAEKMHQQAEEYDIVLDQPDKT